ncbi:MAG: hypothetical protein EA397_17050 [Deltaproteobacteria bacterium]|nr:MAG: hypothetical protein EA397_17050 [Deltaproteobacteria bacterium]
MATVGIWIKPRPGGRPGRPQDWPLGRAAIEARAMGVDVVIGLPDGPGTFQGSSLHGEGWRPCSSRPVDAVYDRFPSIGHPDEAARGVAWLGGIPLANPPALIACCHDKVRCQTVLEQAGISMPDLCDEPLRFSEHLARWGQGFLKPRGGSFGEGVERVLSGTPLPADGAWILQRAISAPQGWAGVSVRVLVQAFPEQGWIAHPPVVRRSATDPVVNAARGADLVPADVPSLDLPGGLDLSARAQALAEACAVALDEATGARGVELGVDLVLDADGRLWPIEVNGRPQGRLAALAQRWPERFRALHLQACTQPLVTLAARSASR